MRKIKLLIYFLLFGIIGFASSANAQSKKVLIAGTDGPYYPTWLEEVRQKIQNTGNFSQVDKFDLYISTPSIATLQSYDAVLVYSNGGYHNATLLGDNLAAYINGGGGVVSSVFDVASVPIGGAFTSDVYRVIKPLWQTQETRRTLGTILLPSHPTMLGISSFDAGSSSFRTTSTTMTTGSYRVANYDNGEFLVVAKDNVGPSNAKRVDLNFFPPSSDSRYDFWVSTTQGAKLMANALLYVADATVQHSISTSPLSKSTFCSGETISLNFTTNSTYNSNNTFIAQLSDVSGSFASPTNIGSVESIMSGTISVAIPAVITPGSGYRIRVVSNNPAIVGSDNGSNITINAKPVVTATVSDAGTGAVVPQTMSFGAGGDGTFLGQGPGAIQPGGRTNIYSNMNTTGYNGLWWTFTPIENPRHTIAQTTSTGNMAFSNYNPATGIITFTSTVNMIWQANSGTENIATRMRIQLQPYTGSHSGPLNSGWITPVTAGGISLASLPSGYPLIDIKALGSPAAYQVWYIIETASGVPLAQYYSTYPHTSTVGGQIRTSFTGSFFSSSLATCKGGPSLVNVSATGGLAPYTGTGVFQALPGNRSFTVTDANGCSGTTSVVVAPQSCVELSCVADRIVNTDANACSAVVTDVDPIIAPAGSAVTYTLSGATTGSGTGSVSGLTFNLGTTTVTYTSVEEPSKSCSFTITVEDKVKPTVVTKSITIQLNGNGTVSITPSDINDGSSDNCSIPSNGYALDKTDFNCSNLGDNTVKLTVTDIHGNSHFVTAIVTVEDKVAPVPTAAELPDLTAECSLTATAPTATDNCKGAVTGTTTDPLTYSTQGTHTITWKYDDGNGNVTTQTQKVIIKDVTPPFFPAINDKIIVINPATCQGKVPNLVIGLNGTDNCGNGNVYFTQSISEDDDIEVEHGKSRTVIITAHDGHGNSFSREVKLLGKDNTPPSFTCPSPMKVNLNSGCSIVVPDLVSGLKGDPNCGVAVGFTQSPAAGTIISSSHGQTHIVTITADDKHGNVTSDCKVVLTAQDVTAPGFTTSPANITISCEASTNPAVNPALGVAAASDNCTASPTISRSDISTQVASINDAGHYNYTITRTWTATDAQENSSSYVQTIMVEDKKAPTVTTKNISVYLNLDGTVSITASDINDGSSDNCSPVTLSIDKNAFNTGNMGANTVKLTVTDVSGNSASANATVTVMRRPTTLVYTGDGSEQYSDQQTLTAVLKDQLTGTLLSGKSIKFDIGTQTASNATNASGIANTNLILTQDPAPVYTVESNFAGDAIFAPSSDTDPFDILQEDARTYYTGALFASTASATSSSATITLSATVRDITAETGDPAHDVFAGDIRKARVKFINRDNGTDISGWLTPGLVSANDLKTGAVTFNWTTNINGDAQQYTIGIIVGDHYVRSSSDENTVVTVAKPLNDFITGGGYLILDKSSGVKAGSVGTKNNFGFNVKFNKSQTSLQGNINTIIRRMEDDGLHVYQVKGNVMTSLSAASATATSPGRATFNGKASIQDITNPLNPVSVDGNATLQVVMSDRGEPGNTDAIAITVWNKLGGVWYASNWDGVKTIEQMLSGGNLRVNAGGSTTGTIANTITLTSTKNPSSSGESVTFRAVINESDAAVPTGYITFANRTTVLATVPVTTASGITSASFSTSSLAIGSHTIRAYYSGDNKFRISESVVLTQVVNPAGPALRSELTVTERNSNLRAERFSMQALPNPSVHQFRIVLQSNLDQPVTIRITDVLGRVVESRSNVAPNSTLQVGSTYRPGVYLIEAAQDNHKQTIKLLKQ